MTLGVQALAGLAVLGAFTLAYAPTMIGLTAQRLLLSQSLMRGAHVTYVQGLPLAVATLWSLSVAASVCAVLILSTPSAFLLIPILSLFTLLQDFLRYMFLGSRQAANAFTADLVWFLVGMIGLFVAYLRVESALQSILMSQTVGAVIATIMLLHARMRVRARYPSGLAPVKPLFLESVFISMLPYASQYLVAFFVGLSVVGEFRSAQLLMVPVTMLATQVQAIVFPRLRPENARAVQKWGSICAVLALSAGLGVMMVRWLDPWRVFNTLGFGHGADFYLTVLLLALGATVSLYLMVYMVRIRVILDRSIWLRWRLGSAVLEPFVSITAGLALGAPGLACGSVASNLVAMSGIGWNDRRLRDRRRRVVLKPTDP